MVSRLAESGRVRTVLHSLARMVRAWRFARSFDQNGGGGAAVCGAVVNACKHHEYAARQDVVSQWLQQGDDERLANARQHTDQGHESHAACEQEDQSPVGSRQRAALCLQAFVGLASSPGTDAIEQGDRPGRVGSKLNRARCNVRQKSG